MQAQQANIRAQTQFNRADRIGEMQQKMVNALLGQGGRQRQFGDRSGIAAQHQLGHRCGPHCQRHALQAAGIAAQAVADQRQHAGCVVLQRRLENHRRRAAIVPGPGGFARSPTAAKAGKTGLGILLEEHQRINITQGRQGLTAGSKAGPIRPRLAQRRDRQREQCHLCLRFEILGVALTRQHQHLRAAPRPGLRRHAQAVALDAFVAQRQQPQLETVEIEHDLGIREGGGPGVFRLARAQQQLQLQLVCGQGPLPLEADDPDRPIQRRTAAIDKAPARQQRRFMTKAGQGEADHLAGFKRG